MPVRATTLKRDPASGNWKARKAIPTAIRDAYATANGPRHEAKFSAPASEREQDAKALFAEWHASIEAQFKAIRDKQDGVGGTLNRKEAHALAGRWYTWFIEHYEPILDTLKVDQWMDALADDMDAIWRAHFDDGAGGLLRFDWEGHQKARLKVLAVIAKNSNADAFLAISGEQLKPSAREEFLSALLPDLNAALVLLKRRSGGDYTPDPRPQRFPTRNKAAGLRPTELFAAYVLASKPAKNTVIRWRNIFTQLDTFFPGRDAGSLTDEDAFKWREDLRKRLSDKSVNEGYVVAAKAVFNWAVNERKLSHNPFTSLKASSAAKRKVKVRERSFRDSELKTILEATVAPTPPRMTARRIASRRWVPWLLIYSGARPGEICQLRKEDVKQVKGAWALCLTPDAGTIKDHEARTIPIHEHLIEQGFIEFVKAAPKGPLFYDPNLLRKEDTDPTNPRRHPAEKARMVLAEWVRDLGVDDPDISPMHAFRHTWKTNALHAGVDKVVRDFVQGHKPETVGDAYNQLEGDKGFAILQRELKKYPRIQLT
ncbi:integrase [alpha proteobacterium U9-1i]|nr:integrase [alpha proteobacterium U9-1i]